MKLEEVLPALRAGKRVAWAKEGWPVRTVESADGLVQALRDIATGAAFDDNWSIVEEPATDEELAAAFEARAEQIWRKHGVDGPGSEYDSLYEAADMVRKRYVDPSWKVGK